MKNYRQQTLEKLSHKKNSFFYFSCVKYQVDFVFYFV